MIEGRKGKVYKGEEAIDNERAIKTRQWKKETMEKRERHEVSASLPHEISHMTSNLRFSDDAVL